MSRFAPIAIGLIAVAVLAGCTQLQPLPTPTPTPTPTGTASLDATGDGVLRIGTLFPMTGDTAAIGPALVAAVEVAVRDINVAGGVLGQPVEMFSRNSGEATEQLLESGFAALVERGVDVVIGPTTSVLVERLLPLAEAAGVTVITPAATAPAISAAAPQKVLFRTILAADQQGAAIINALADDGAESVALITTGDVLGVAFEASTRAALQRRGMRLTSIEQLDAATTVNRLAFSITGGEPDAIILATSATLAEQNQTVLAALLARGITADQLWLTAQNLADYSATLAAGTLEGANGVLDGAPVSDELTARLLQSDPALRGFRFAPETYDAVILSALGAVLAGDDSGTSIAREVTRATSDGVLCSSFGECIEVLSTEPAINYNGLSGPLTFDSAGGLTEGELGLYRYTAGNVAERVGSLVVADD